MKKIYRSAVIMAVCAVLCMSLTGCGTTDKLSDLVGRETAKEVALADAGFPERWVIEMDVDLDREAGEHVYDIFFINATTKYRYIVDGDTGSIVSRHTEPLFPTAEED